jgi:hypothetical protein
MLHTISWFEFLQILLFILVCYYLLTAVLFYKKEIASLFAYKMINGNPEPHVTRSPRPENNSNDGNDENDSFVSIHELLEDLKVLFNKASETKMIKEELLQAIRSRLNSYPKIKETDLVDDINIHLTAEAKEVCAMDLSVEDLRMIWNA